MDSKTEKELVKNLEMKCVSEAETHPTLDPQADEWFKRARAIQKHEIEGTNEEVVELYKKAIERKHWKAYSNLADMYLHGNGIKRDTSKGIDILEVGMKLNYARCYAMMGNCLAYGVGVRQDDKASWAYHRKAAELGDSGSQVLVGDKIRMSKEMGGLELPDIGNKIIECADRQNDPQAAYELGTWVSFPEGSNFDQKKALYYLQRSTQFGKFEAARRLWSTFKEGEMQLAKDPERAKRYDKIMDFLEPFNNRHIYPLITNLDDIVPLPPAPLPKWDGKIEVEKK
jgi:hypothetical protein